VTGDEHESTVGEGLAEVVRGLRNSAILVHGMYEVFPFTVLAVALVIGGA
jgi:hypothetical protein